MKFVFTPVGLIAGLAAGQLAKRIFDLIWGLFDDEEAPRPKHRDIPLAKMLFALLVEGAIFRLTGCRRIVDCRGLAQPLLAGARAAALGGRCRPGKGALSSVRYAAQHQSHTIPRYTRGVHAGHVSLREQEVSHALGIEPTQPRMIPGRFFGDAH